MASLANGAFYDQYDVDKIVGIFTGSFNAATLPSPSLGYALYQFPHSFNRPVFCEIMLSSDNITYYDGNQGFTGAAAIAYADSSNIYILTNVNSGTLYYKVICSWIDNYDTNNPGITPSLTPTTGDYFDSRFNYQKIYQQGVLTATNTGDNTFTIPHNLGYVPNHKIFLEVFSNQVWPSSGIGTSNFWLYDSSHQSDGYALATTTQLKIDCFIPASGHSTRIWYRIYLDT